MGLLTVSVCFRAQLWNHGKLEEADIPEDSDLAQRLETDAPYPPLDLTQVHPLSLRVVRPAPAAPSPPRPAPRGGPRQAAAPCPASLDCRDACSSSACLGSCVGPAPRPQGYRGPVRMLHIHLLLLFR